MRLVISLIGTIVLQGHFREIENKYLGVVNSCPSYYVHGVASSGCWTFNSGLVSHMFLFQFIAKVNRA